MKLFKDIVEDLKDILSSELGNRRVKDSDIAKILEVSPGSLATNKARNVVMFLQLAEFCASRRLSINSLLFDQSPESLVSETNRQLFNHRYHLAS